MKRYRFTLAALLIFAILLAWVLTQERGRVPEEGEIFRFSPQQIVKLEVNQDDNKLVLERRDQQWYLIEPLHGLADSDKVDSMLKSLVQIKPGKREGVDLANPDYGLDQPVLTVTFETRAGRATTVKLGAKSGTGDDHFATISGRPELYLIKTSFKTALEKSADDLRDKTLVGLKKEDVRRLKIERPATTIIAERISAGDTHKWQLRQPVEAAADRFAVEDMVDGIIRAKAASFADRPEDLGSVGLDKPQAIVSLTTTDGQERTFRIGKQIEKEVPKEYGEGTEQKQVVYVDMEQRPQLLLVTADLLNQVSRSLFDLRDKTVLDFAKEKVLQVKVQSKQKLNFAASKNQDGQWMLAAPVGMQAQADKIDDILWDLGSLQAAAFEKEQPEQGDLMDYGLAVPHTVITLKIAGQSRSIKVRLGNKAQPGARYCQTSESEQVYQINATVLLDDLPADLEALTSPEETESQSLLQPNTLSQP